MASAKSLEDMLSSEVDESAVNALVGSLESQLSSPNIHIPSQDIAPGAVAANHMNSNPTNSDGGLQRLQQAQHDASSKHVAAVSAAATNPTIATNQQAANAPANNKISTQVATNNNNSSNSGAVTSAPAAMVTLAGALPASGYINQVTGALAGGARPDIKIVYSPQQQTTHFNNNSVIQRKVVTQNGNMMTRPNTPVTTSTMSAMQNLANVAAQQQPIIIGGPGPAYTLAQAQLNAKQLVAQRMTVREQLEQGKDGKKVGLKDGGTPPPSATPNLVMQHPHSPQMMQVSSATPTVITVSKPSQSQSGQQQVVSHSNLIPGVQIVNMGNPRAHNMGGPKTLAPRMVIGNPVRIAAATSPQVIGRPGAPGVQMDFTRYLNSDQFPKNTITLQPGMVRGALLFKTENGQFQVLNVAQGLTPTTQATGALPGGTTYRLQSVQPGQGAIRTLAPQQMTVTLPVSSNVKQQQQLHTHQKGPGGQMVGTVLQHGQGINVVTTVGGHLHSATLSSSTIGTMQQQHNVSQQHAMAVKVGGGTVVTSGTNATQPLTIHTTTANSQSATTPSQMSPNTAKKKCKNFLSTLIRLATDQPEQVATNVKNLIQGLIDGAIQPEDFTNQLQKELNSSPQPCLVPFLKKSLPYLRHSLMTKELTIEGVRPPAPGAVTLPPTPTAIPPIQITQTRPHTPGPPVRLMGQMSGSALTAQLSQPLATPSLLAQQRVATPRLPMVVTQTKSLLVTSLSNSKASSVHLTTSMAQSSMGTTVTAGAANASSLSTAAIMSPATVGALQSRVAATARSTAASNAAKEKEKRNFASLSSSRDDDDINDVAAMGGVNLVEESQRILAANAEIVGTQIRSCKDENFLYTSPLLKRISSLVSKHGIDEPSSEIVSLISHATQERLKSLVEKLGVIAEHRLENIKNDPRFEITQDVKGQLKFLEELDRLEKKRHEEQEREILLRAAKSRSKLEDPEQLKLKQKAKEMQRAEMEEMRQREANATALLAIGTRKRQKIEPGGSSLGTTPVGSSGTSNPSNSASKSQIRPRVKRVNLRDLLFLMEQERETVRTPFLYKSYFK